MAPDDTGDVTLPPATARAFAGRFSSPSIVRVGTVDHVFLAKQTIRIDGQDRVFRVPHTTYENGVWSAPEEVLPALGNAARKNGPVWAPAVARISATQWMLYYTAEPVEVVGTTSKKKCLFRARASTPSGPFVDDYDAPLTCLPGSLWALDAYAVLDARGNWNLAARLDLGKGINSIQIHRLTPDGEHLAKDTTWRLLARNEQGSWDQHVMENAGVVQLAPPGGGQPHWFVFYSARKWKENSYSIGYVDCGENIEGLADDGCIKRTPKGPWLGSSARDELWGPGTPTFYGGDVSSQLMSIQAWRHAGGVATGAPNQAANSSEGQIMHTYRISIDDAYVPHLTFERTDL